MEIPSRDMLVMSYSTSRKLEKQKIANRSRSLSPERCKGSKLQEARHWAGMFMVVCQ